MNEHGLDVLKEETCFGSFFKEAHVWQESMFEDMALSISRAAYPRMKTFFN
jgi:hypothetical protein